MGSYYEGKECKKFGFLWSKRDVYVAGLRLIENFTKVIVKGCYIDIGQPATHEKPLK